MFNMTFMTPATSSHSERSVSAGTTITSVPSTFAHSTTSASVDGEHVPTMPLRTSVYATHDPVLPTKGVPSYMWHSYTPSIPVVTVVDAVDNAVDVSDDVAVVVIVVMPNEPHKQQAVPA